MTLAVNQLIGFGAAQSEQAAVTKTYRGSQTNTSDLTTYNSFSTVSVSTTDTYFVVGVVYRADVNRTVSTITVTGNNSGARTVYKYGGASAATGGDIAIASLSGDTSVTVTVTLSGAGTACAIACWSGSGNAAISSISGLFDISHTYSSSGFGNVDNGGAGFSITINSNTTTPTVSWSGWTEDDEWGLESGRVASAGSVIGPDTSATITYSAALNPGIAMFCKISPA